MPPANNTIRKADARVSSSEAETSSLKSNERDIMLSVSSQYLRRKPIKEILERSLMFVEVLLIGFFLGQFFKYFHTSNPKADIWMIIAMLILSIITLYIRFKRMVYHSTHEAKTKKELNS